MIITRQFNLQTKGHCDIIDITPLVARQVGETPIVNGTVTIFIAGSTAGVTTIEYESGVLGDLQDMWKRIIPENMSYQHDRRWGDGNGYAHVRAQQIVLVDFDNRARSRQVILQLSGE
jgi:thiamine phosphate synthase YjbQ (UPF0047 family)